MEGLRRIPLLESIIKGVEMRQMVRNARRDLTMFIEAGASQRVKTGELFEGDTVSRLSTFGDRSFLVIKTSTHDEQYGDVAERFYSVMYVRKDGTVSVFRVDERTGDVREISAQAVTIGGSIIGGESNSMHTIERIEVYKLGLPVGIQQPVTKFPRQAVPHAA